jgi:hypothetical protein
MKPEKCFFHTTSVNFLGFILSPEGLSMDPDKVQVIQDWPEPQKVKDIQSFLGFANFYCWFIYNYLGITALLSHLTHKGTLWQFSEECRNAFKTFTSAPVLLHWN